MILIFLILMKTIDSSYGYKNGDGSKYYKSESGRAVYTAPNGVKYDKSEYHEPQPSTRYDYNASQQPAYDGRASNGSASPSRYGGRDYFQHEYADRNENSGRYEERTQSHPYHNTTPKEEQESYQSKDMSPWESHDRHEESYEEHGHGDYDNGDDEHYEEQDDGGYDDGEYAYDYHYDFYWVLAIVSRSAKQWSSIGFGGATWNCLLWRITSVMVAEKIHIAKT